MFRYTFSDIELVSNEAIAELTPLTIAQADSVSVLWGTTAPDVRPDWFHRWGDGASDWARFGAVDDGWVIEFPTLARFGVDRVAHTVSVWPQPGVPRHTLHHLLLNQVMPLVIARRGRVVLHAGAVAIGGHVVAFVGPTGSGKSTLVAACGRAGAEVVCDDSLVVRRDAGHWVGIPSYPALRLWHSALERVGWAGQGRPAAHYTEKRRISDDQGHWRFASGPRLFSRIVLLEHEDPPRPAAVEVFSQIFRLDVRDRAEGVHLFHVVADLLADVTVTRLGPRETRDAVAIAAALVGGHVATDATVRA